MEDETYPMRRAGEGPQLPPTSFHNAGEVGGEEEGAGEQNPRRLLLGKRRGFTPCSPSPLSQSHSRKAFSVIHSGKAFLGIKSQTRGELINKSYNTNIF